MATETQSVRDDMPKSYVGEKQVGRCTSCGTRAMIAGDEFQQDRKRPYMGQCTECEDNVRWEPVE